MGPAKMNQKKIQAVFETAEKEGHSFLLEHEVYSVLRCAGLPTPNHFIIEKGKKLKREELAALGSKSVVLKIVSPLILHKSDAGGVRFVKAEASAVNKACREMMEEVPGRFLSWAEKFDEARLKSMPTRKAVKESIRGILVCEKIEFEDVGFGSELLAGIKNSREFGPVMTVGSGGLDVKPASACPLSRSREIGRSLRKFHSGLYAGCRRRRSRPHGRRKMDGGAPEGGSDHRRFPGVRPLSGRGSYGQSRSRDVIAAVDCTSDDGHSIKEKTPWQRRSLPDGIS